MKPILYSDTETEFNTNGFGILNDATTAKVRRRINSFDELEMKYPVKGIHYSELKKRRIILADRGPTSQMQPYRIYKITKPFMGIVTVFARHISYDLDGIPVVPFTAIGANNAMSDMKSHAVADCPFSFTTDINSDVQMKVTAPISIWNLLGGTEGSLLDTYGGEYEFDRFEVALKASLGSDNGVAIRYGKNMTGLVQNDDSSSQFTGIYPFWTDMEGNTVELPEKIVNVEGSFSFTRIRVLDFSAEWMEKPTEDQLRERTKRFISDNRIGTAKNSIKVSFVNLDQTAEYKNLGVLERVSLGDTVCVYYEELGIDGQSRVIETDFDILGDRYNSVTMGDVQASFADTIVDQKHEIEKKPSQNIMQSIAQKLSDAMTGAKGGAVRLLDNDGDGMPDELYIADNADPAQAIRVWRFNYLGWAASSNGYNGPFEFGATLEDGLLANFVTAAHLVAGTIQSADGETFFLDLDNGILKMKIIDDAVNDLQLQIDANQETITRKFMELETNADGLASTVSKQTESINGIKDEMTQVQQKSDEIAFIVKNISDNGVDHVETTTGVYVRDDGVHVEREGDEVNAHLAHDGLRVNALDDARLIADVNGVDAYNLKAHNYLTIGHARFEAYGSDQTACFYV